MHRFEAQRFGGLVLVADIDFAGRIVADQNRGQSRNQAVLGLEPRGFLGDDAPRNCRRMKLAVDDGCAHLASPKASRRAAKAAPSPAISIRFKRADAAGRNTHGRFGHRRGFRQEALSAPHWPCRPPAPRAHAPSDKRLPSAPFAQPSTASRPPLGVRRIEMNNIRSLARAVTAGHGSTLPGTFARRSREQDHDEGQIEAADGRDKAAKRPEYGFGQPSVKSRSDRRGMATVKDVDKGTASSTRPVRTSRSERARRSADEPEYGTKKRHDSLPCALGRTGHAGPERAGPVADSLSVKTAALRRAESAPSRVRTAS